ncbi:2-oxo acid dehydrogenase subunit E2, partial [Acidithiobacillus sp.]|uniref:2-oxo acid dehydrogenase subunit E2 n=1 Tax=Acidithiobacillus sp. TaxID=1872118 RepID=UPI0025C2D4E7
AATSTIEKSAPAPVKEPAAAAQPSKPPAATPAAAPIDTSAASSPVVTAALTARQSDTAGTTPFVRALAAELGIDLEQLGADANSTKGHISAARVLAAAIGPQAPQLTYAPPHTIEHPSAIKAAMAENMARSVHTPTFHITIAVDLKPLHDAAQAEQESLSLLLARACALSVQEHPEFNACWTPGGLARRERIDIAIAVDTPDGLITPVLCDVLRPLGELDEDWRGLKGKLAKRRLKPEDYSGATFYLSNLGLFPGIEQFDAIVPSGAAAILAVAAPSADGLTRLTLSCDHRVVAGADAARFLTTLSGHLAAVDKLA